MEFRRKYPFLTMAHESKLTGFVRINYVLIYEGLSKLRVSGLNSEQVPCLRIDYATELSYSRVAYLQYFEVFVPGYVSK